MGFVVALVGFWGGFCYWVLKFPAPPIIRYLVGGFLLIFFILGPILTALRYLRRDARSSTRITVTPVLLRVEELAGRKSQTTEIPADELEELDLPTIKEIQSSIRMPDKFPKLDLPESGIPRLPDGRPIPKILVSLMRLFKSPGIIARSDSASVQFGSGLPEEELRYLHALVKKVLTRR